MSGVLIQELLHDASMKRIHIDLYADLAIAVETVFRSGVFGKRDVKILDLYLCGYTVEEIGMSESLHTETIIEILSRLFTAIEETSGYTDQDFIQRMRIKYKNRPLAIKKLQLYLQQRSL